MPARKGKKSHDVFADGAPVPTSLVDAWPKTINWIERRDDLMTGKDGKGRSRILSRTSDDDPKMLGKQRQNDDVLTKRVVDTRIGHISCPWG